ncbi:DUF3592 domain-containing protein [Rhizobium sp. C4]|uniref:DUF3592 domain-containing protein n=1 Tax=Rhizobium sp. C4 TaxID=1349800 RepID=UPI001E637FFE|nr:DUF3592 domain-containing protein [Rhizobium sp. C4]MCD2171869.1 hypothetical protein [Rhizobium sp. C4]
MLIVIRLLFSAGLSFLVASLALYFSNREAQLARDLLANGVAVKAAVKELREHDCRRRDACGGRVSYSFTDRMGNVQNGAGDIREAELLPLIAGSTEFRQSPSLRSVVKFDHVPLPGATVDVLYRDTDPSTHHLRSTLINWTWQDPLLLSLLSVLFFVAIYYWTGLMASTFLGVPRERWLVWIENQLWRRNPEG